MTAAAAKEEQCGFSCTYAKKKVYQQFADLIHFSTYDPKTAIEIADEMHTHLMEARRIIYANLVKSQSR